MSKSEAEPVELTAIDAELTVLGGLILDPDQLEAVSKLVGPADFWRPYHRTVYELLQAMARDRVPIELVSVMQRVRATRHPEEFGGLAFVSGLPDQVVSTENLEHYARTVRLYSLRRATRDLARRLSTMLTTGAEDQERDLAEVLTRASQELFAVIVQVGKVRAFDGPDPLVRAKLAMNQQRMPRATLSNLSIIFGEDPRWRTLRLNRMGDSLEWQEKSWEQGPSMRAETSMWLARHYGIEAGGPLIEEALLGAAAARAYLPVRAYLEGLLWDGEKRIDRLLSEALGCEPSVLHAAYVRRFLIGAVARALSPGCKVDTALILVGKQGTKKSTFFKALFGDQWFGDSPIPIGDKDAAILLRSVWGFEAAEMEDLSRKTAEAVKQFMSTGSDLFRTPFERAATHKPRHSVLCGSTNKPEFLTDSTGNRRFWPLTVPDAWVIPITLVSAWRDQLWAEALAAYLSGERWWFDRDEEEDLGRDEDMAQYQEADPWEADVREALKNVFAPFSAAEILVWLKFRAEERNPANMRRVGRIVATLGGYQSKVFRQKKGPSVRRWFNPEWPVQEESDG